MKKGCADPDVAVHGRGLGKEASEATRKWCLGAVTLVGVAIAAFVPLGHAVSRLVRGIVVFLP